MAALCHEAFKYLALVIGGPPEGMLHPVDLHEDFVEVTPPILKMPHCLDPAPSNLRRENRPETVSPEPHGLMRDVDTALVQQVLDIAL